MADVAETPPHKLKLVRHSSLRLARNKPSDPRQEAVQSPPAVRTHIRWSALRKALRRWVPEPHKPMPQHRRSYIYLCHNFAALAPSI